MPLEMVAAALGHAGTELTYKTYLHFFPDQWARYMAGMDAFLAAPDVQITPLRQAGASRFHPRVRPAGSGGPAVGSGSSCHCPSSVMER